MSPVQSQTDPEMSFFRPALKQRAPEPLFSPRSRKAKRGPGANRDLSKCGSAGDSLPYKRSPQGL